MADEASVVDFGLESKAHRTSFTGERWLREPLKCRFLETLRAGRFFPGISQTLAISVLASVLAQEVSLAQTVVHTNSTGSLVLTNGFGDLNNDQLRDVRDLVLITHLINGTGSVPPFAAARSDINEDAVVNDADRRILAAIIAGRQTRADEDFDGDELPNAEEFQHGTNPLLPDSDGDGWLDGWEVAEGSNPLNAQSGLKLLVVARPTVQVLHPLIQNEDTNTLGTVIARPPIQILHPLIQNTDTNLSGAVIARPPVQVTGPP